MGYRKLESRGYFMRVVDFIKLTRFDVEYVYFLDRNRHEIFSYNVGTEVLSYQIFAKYQFDQDYIDAHRDEMVDYKTVFFKEFYNWFDLDIFYIEIFEFGVYVYLDVNRIEVLEHCA